MRITTLKVKNFRALTDIETTFTPRCNVVVGPNAIGKTTLLDAIRLVKALLAPRTQNETNQVLFALGVSSPHFPSELHAETVANDSNLPLIIDCGFQFTPEELNILESDASIVPMATQLMLSTLGRQFSSQPELIGLLSSPQGRQQLERQVQELKAVIAEIKSEKRKCAFQVRFDLNTGQINSDDQFSTALVAFLERKLPPNRTLFSYFPADRAIPTQEQPVQIGPGDVASQLESHNSQPQLKYSRLKNTIFNAVVTGKGNDQANQFKAIFSRILKGRTLSEVRVSDRGILRIQVEDDDTKRSFGIEAMSSGEKGLILTCLIIAQTLEKGGIVLLDEPELHLNPAVCKEVLNFLIDEYAVPNDLQLIICSHSPEILGSAFDRDDCELYHLISGDVLTPVRKQDLEEVGKALRKLGASQTESLLYRGTVFVEGYHDSDLLQQGFKGLFQRYLFRDLGGRKNIEKEVQVLQSNERTSKHGLKTYFILDKDDEPTTLNDSESVRVLQWRRRCLENYLLDFDALTDIGKDESLAANPITNIAALKQSLKRLAMTQLGEIAFWSVLKEYASSNISLKSREVQGKKISELADVVFDQIKLISERYSSLDEMSWKQKFIQECQAKRQELAARWEDDWVKECDGKQLIRDIHSELKIKESLLKFKLRIIAGMERGKSENWLAMQSLLSNLMLGGQTDKKG